MKKTLIIGSTTHEQADTIEWKHPFGDNLEKYERLIIDLTSFPKDFPRPNPFHKHWHTKTNLTNFHEGQQNNFLHHG